MSVVDRWIARRRGYSGQRRLMRSLLAAPFALSLLLALVLGPATSDSRHGTFIWLAVLSLVAALVMLGASEALLIPVGVVTFLVFPPVAGLGFYFAPAWAEPSVAITFYGSMLAAAGAVLIGLLSVAWAWSHRQRRGASSLVAASLGVVALFAVVGHAASAPATNAGPAARALAPPVNMGPIINAVIANHIEKRMT